ncbi:MAG: hypothetical protein QOD99_2818 [Chthoniobacter sp.]|jgi:hypothetical protein|nr:hypothetical protein [Chthoniobacter sp.]
MKPLMGKGQTWLSVIVLLASASCRERTTLPVKTEQPATPTAPPASPAAAETPEPEVAAVTPAPTATPKRVIELAEIIADPTLWPKTVAIKKAMEFPAVIQGKAVGKLNVPSGTLTHLVQIRNGMMGLEYKGGGGWHKPEETDLLERVRATQK